MNKAKTWSGAPTKEVRFYMRQVEQVCSQAAANEKIEARFFKSIVRERVGIKRAITGGGAPAQLAQAFSALWLECVDYLKP
ncbi:MAG: hypothetical protein ACREQC_03580 [Candidatus Binataceae bacterium]